MRRLDVSPLPAAFEVEVVDRGVAKVEREGPLLETREDKSVGRPTPDKANPAAIQGAALKQARRLGLLGLGHRVVLK